jgi:hypothetical protein
MKNKNSLYHLNLQKMGIGTLADPFRNKITKHFDGQSITYKYEHFAENYIKIG